MRIIAGSKRATKLFSPTGDVSRPIIDRVKQSLFDVLYNYGMPEGKIVADLFCGVGSLGLEALSRGAKFALFIEKDPQIASVLKRNIEKCGFVDKSKIIKTNAFFAGVKPFGTIQNYDLVFVDPPYVYSRDVSEQSALGGLLLILSKQLPCGAIVVVRTEENIVLLEEYGKIKVLERRCWGSMAVTILRAEQNE
ncbi:MAG: RsmD family RNA methyltransferase [Phycisphaerae bacterium]